MEAKLVLRPNTKKSLLKATIGIAVFSLLLEVTPATFLNYLLFLAVFYSVVGVYVMSKHFTLYTIDEQGVTIAPWLRASRTVGFADMAELAVVQGMLARRFHCGTVFMVVKSGGGHVRIMGGGGAEAMKDVPHPQAVADAISSRLAPFGGDPARPTAST